MHFCINVIEQGVDLGDGLRVSATGLADDTALSANSLSCLSNILYLTLDYCAKYMVSLCPDKTRLLRITGKQVKDMELFNPIKISGKNIQFSNQAEHVGIVRSVDGNLPNLLNRISCHKKALGATLCVGLAKRQRSNPVVGLHIERLYGTPVLMSGLASLVMSGSDMEIVESHYKCTYQNIQKLLPNTPRCVVFFLAGMLPISATIDLRRLCLFGMITRLRGDPLNTHARRVLVQAKTSSKSWFIQLRDICLKYKLPHPLSLLDFPPSRKDFKKITTSHVHDFWEQKLRGEAALLPSLIYFSPQFMSLRSPHPIWTTAMGNPYEVAKAIQQARLLSGRYRTEYLCRHWSRNRAGYCLSLSCKQQQTPETVEHILLDCSEYSQLRDDLVSFWHKTSHPIVHSLAIQALGSSRSYLIQFLLDCSVLPQVIVATQCFGTVIMQEIFHLTRTWCFSVHRLCMKRLGRWNIQM